jgi:hypothetical protein
VQLRNEYNIHILQSFYVKIQTGKKQNSSCLAGGGLNEITGKLIHFKGLILCGQRTLACDVAELPYS